MRPTLIDHNRQHRLFSCAPLWLLVGGVLLLTTLVPVHTALFGWMPLFWLLIAPLAVMLVVQPQLIRRRRMHRRAPRRRGTQPVWH